MVKIPEDKKPKLKGKKMSEKESLEHVNNALLKEKAEALFQSSYEAREKYDWEWMTRDLFRRGYQFSSYDESTKTILLSSKRGVKFPINLLWAQMRSVKNQVTNFKPKWEVLPSGKSEESTTNAKYSGRLLDYYYHKLGLRKKLKETIIQGLIFSVGGPWQIGFDPNGDNGNGEVYCWLIDTYDFYVDPYATSLEDAEYCIKAVRRPLDEIKTNPEFEFYGDLPETGEVKLAASPSKQFLLQSLKTHRGMSSQEEEEGGIVKEGWIKTRVSEENKELLAEELRKNDEDDKELLVGEILMRIVHWVDFVEKPLRVQLKRRSDFPFIIYQADINPLELYGESWSKHIIPINRVLNALESSVFNYHYKYAVGRIVIDKNSGVKTVSNQHGDFIEKNRGSEVTSLPLAPLPNSYQTQIDNCHRYIEDLGGAHEACVSDDTEALTKEGWKTRELISTEDEIYTINPKTLLGEWNSVSKIYEYKKEGAELYKIENKNISALVTGSHRWLVKTKKGNGKRGDYVEKYEFRETTELNGNSFIPLGAKLSSQHKQEYSDDFVELVGWVITEGCYSQGPKSEARGRTRIRISQSYHANPVQWRMIDNLLKRMGINTTPQLQKDKSTQFSFSKENAVQMRKLFPDKLLTYEFVKRLTAEQLEILLKTMMLGDGTIERGTYYSTEKQNIDAFQMICSLLGYSSRIFNYGIRERTPFLRGEGELKEFYGVSIKSETNFTGFSSHERLDKFIKKEKYTGTVWCPETKNTTWLMRKDGKVCFTGNSLGRIPSGVKSGVGIAELKQADSTNSSDLVDNMEDFLVTVGHKILREVAENYDAPKVIKDLGMGGDTQHFAVVGEKSGKSRKNKREVKIGVDNLDLAVIGSDNEIRVTIGSWLAYTKTAKQEKIRELFEAGMIDQKTALMHLEFPDIDKIVENVRKEEVLKKMSGSSAQGSEGVSDEEIARQENIMITQEGKEIEPLVTDNHTIHNIVHQEGLGLNGNPLLEKHMELHDTLSQRPEAEGQHVNQQVMGPPAPPVIQPPEALVGPPQGPQQTAMPPEEEALMASIADLQGGGV